MALANKYNLFVVEDAAQAIDSYYKGKPLGSIGHLAAFSFHETKNISSGEGGMLVVNDAQFEKRAEIIWEKGTNRTAFFRGEVDKYGWVDVGSSFLPSDLIAAVLWAQLEAIDDIQKRRKEIWAHYYEELKGNGLCGLPYIPDYATNNAHMFYLVMGSLEERDQLIKKMKEAGIMAVFHYQSLHLSPFYKNVHGNRSLELSDQYSEQLIRMPFFHDVKFNLETIINLL